MIDLSGIIIGWKNFLVKDAEIEEIAEKRMEICLKCDKLRRDNNRCSVCGCYMVAKTRNPKSTCPLNKWEDINVESEEQKNLKDLLLYIHP